MELDFVGLYDAALGTVQERIDMPDRRASLLVRYLLQNRGTLSKKNRPEIAELTDAEGAAIEGAIREVMEEPAPDSDSRD